MRSIHIAVLDEELPFPLTSGKRIRTYSLIARLAKNHRITILCHQNPNLEESAAAQAAFRELGVSVIVVRREVPPKSGPGFYTRLAGNLLSPLPYSVATHTSSALIVAVTEFARDNPVDIWHCEWTPYAQVLRQALGNHLNAACWTVMAHNVESLIWQRYAETEINPAKRWYIRKQCEKFEHFEKWAYNTATVPIAVSDEDAQMMRNAFGVKSAEVVENGVDLDYFKPQRDVERNPNQLLFLGSLDWRPNLDAAASLLNEIFPKVRVANPAATLHLVGRRPPEWLTRQASATPGVRLFADVPDVRPFLASSGMLVVPLRIGGGSRLKILEALATETPVISTRVGAEGLKLTPGTDFIMTETTGEMAQTIVQAMSCPAELQDSAERGRRRIAQLYSWDRLAIKLENVWRNACRSAIAVNS